MINSFFFIVIYWSELRRLRDEALAKDFEETVELNGEKEKNADTLKEDDLENKKIAEKAKISETPIEPNSNEQTEGPVTATNSEEQKDSNWAGLLDLFILLFYWTVNVIVFIFLWKNDDILIRINWSWITILSCKIFLFELIIWGFRINKVKTKTKSLCIFIYFCDKINLKKYYSPDLLDFMNKI